MRSLTLAKRRELLCLTASSGSLANLRLLLPLVGCTLEGGRGEHNVLSAAAKAGHLHVCQWLRQQGCSWDKDVMKAAGKSGSWQVCEWAIAGGCPGGASAAMRGAARAGHVGLLDRLLAAHGPPGEEEGGRVLEAVAEGCDLASLQRLYAEWRVGAVGVEEENKVHVLTALSRFASASPTPDWRAKMEWLEAAGCSRDQPLDPADCTDAVERLVWLEARGWLVDRRAALSGAAQRGDLACLNFLQPLQPEEQQSVSRMLACEGHLQALQALHARGWALGPDVSPFAARSGHPHVVAWAVETLGGEVLLTDDLFTRAAYSGNLELLVWLRDRGCPGRGVGGRVAVWKLAALSGCQEVLEWLDANGWPLALEGEYVHRCLVSDAEDYGDVATLACLRRLGCVWAEEALHGSA